MFLYNIRNTLSKGLALALLICPAKPGVAAWNDPYPPEQVGASVLYSSFRERPKHLDPARSYSSDEYLFLGQIYEPPLQYHYLRRPFALVPLAALGIPRPRYLDASGSELPAQAAAQDIAFSVYEFRIRPGIMYQPHPALAVDGNGAYRYHSLSEDDLERVHALSDFAYTGTREATADDYVYQVKRLADPARHSPIAGVMAQYIVGFTELAEAIAAARASAQPGRVLDLRQHELSGVKVVDRYTYRIWVKGKYPQFLYWQAMLFFSPMPWEAEVFYAQPGMEEKNLSLDWYPIGTGPFYLDENNPNLRMTLVRNPHFHGEVYPDSGESDDAVNGLLKDAGKPLPFIDRAVFSLEKESIPRWNKFLQGYYDDSGISSDSFDQAVRFNAQGEAGLTDRMRDQGIELTTAVDTAVYYMGFNMLDDVIGGDSDRARMLRRAISIAVDFEEYVSIFMNGRGVVAQGPIPPGIFGARKGEAGVNPYVYDWIDGRPKRKPMQEARRLLAEAGYAGGVDRQTGKPLALNFEAVSRGPDDAARFNWIRKQFDKLGLQLIIRATDYNRFRDKMLKGTGEIFFWGWGADYPDPENFLFLLYGPNAKALHNGENASNYQNPRFDDLFERMKNMDNGPERQALIDGMLDIVRRDAPWIWGFHPQQFSLHHAWLHNVKPNTMAQNTLKYKRIDPGRRRIARSEWNEPVWWPLILAGGVLGMSIVPAVVSFRRRENRAAL